MAQSMLSQDKISTPSSASFPIFASQHSMAPTQEDYLHELRVRIPVDLHRQLLSLKVLRGKSLADTVSTALDIYFAEHQKRSEPTP